MDVIPNSPADHAGLLPYGDYVIGSPEGIVRGESGLGELVDDVCNCSYVQPQELPSDNNDSILTDPSASWSIIMNTMLHVH